MRGRPSQCTPPPRDARPWWHALLRNAPKPDRRMQQLEEEGLEDDAELVERAAYRDREWDDWKDDHPKGSGVTKKF